MTHEVDVRTGDRNMGNLRSLGAVAFAALVLLAQPLRAQTAEPVDPAATTTDPDWQATVDDPAREEAAKQLEDRQRDLELARRQEATLEAGIEQLGRERSQLTEQLVTTAKRVQEAEASLSGVETRLAELSAKEKTLRASLAQQRTVLIKLLAALQRMGRDPPPILITERTDALKMVRSAMQLSTIFPPLKDKAVVLANDLAALDKAIAGIKSENANKIAEKQRLLDEQGRLDGFLKQKHRELAAQETNLDALRDTVTRQAKSVANLSELIAKSDRAVAFRGTLGDADKELTEIQVAEAEPEPAPRTQVAVNDTGQKETGEKPLVKKPPIPINIKAIPGQAFERSKGTLQIPVKGNRILKFGDPTKNVGRSKGEVFTTRPGAQITSPSNGLVVYAGEFRTFGQILIINAGGGYHILLAGLGQLDATTGQAVTAGEPVGKMGAVPGSSAVGGTPVLYVEFRSRDKPINPAPWWAAGEAEKVQG